MAGLDDDDDGAPRPRRLLALGVLALVLAACRSGPPDPLERPPGADMPAWVVDSYEPRRPLAEEAATVNGEDAVQTRPGSREAPRVPARFTAVGQARHVDPAEAERAAQSDARRALGHMLDVRIRRALLHHVEGLEGIETSRREALRGHVWYLEFTELVEALPIELRDMAWDEPPEVAGPPVTFAEAVVPFEAVLRKVHALVTHEFDEFAPSRNRLAALLAQR